MKLSYLRRHEDSRGTGGRIQAVPGEVVSGVQTAFELLEFAVGMRAERFRREHPGATDDEVRSCVRAWLLDRPGAPLGDAVGRDACWRFAQSD